MSTTRLVDTFLILDAHNDSLILRQVRDDPMDLADVDPTYQVDLPRLRKGGMDCLCCMVGDNVSKSCWPGEGWPAIRRQSN